MSTSVAVTTTPTAAVTAMLAVAAGQEVIVAGVHTGLRADVLLAGFVGSVVAMVLLDTVIGDWEGVMGELRGALRRLAVAVSSCLTAGYFVAGVGVNSNDSGTVLFSAFVVGAGAQTILPKLISSVKFAWPSKGE